MILTGPEIRRQVAIGRDNLSFGIHIDPYEPDLVGPNSVDLRLGNKLLVYTDVVQPKCKRLYEGLTTFYNVDPQYDDPIQPTGTGRYLGRMLDMRKENLTQEFEIGDEGFILQPGILYLGSTVERIGSNEFVPIVEGRSSVGRLGVHVHVTAGFCDIGFVGEITLEIHVIHPIRVYADTPICQAYFMTPSGEIELYEGRYQDQEGPVASRIEMHRKKSNDKRT